MKQIESKNNYYLSLKNLFSLARKNGGLNYFYTLLRMKGITDEKDLFVTAKAGQYNPNREALQEDFIIESLEVITNLFNCVLKKEFQGFPFNHLKRGQFPNFQLPETVAVISEIEERFKHSDSTEIKEVIELIRPLTPFIKKGEGSDNKKIYIFIDNFLRCYFSEIKSYKKERKLHRLQGFVVFEILTNEKYGLCGFKMHFSNSSNAFYQREELWTMSVNIMSIPHITFNMSGGISAKNEWMVGDKRLYEIGLAGRYNKAGEWMPIIVEGNPDDISRRCRELAEGDDEVQGCLFYIMCTGHRVIEFVAKSPIDLPITSARVGNKMHLYKCPSLKEGSHATEDFIIYDGYYELQEIDAKAIKSAIANINVALNRLAFAYGSSVEWCLKYRAAVRHYNSQPTPSKKDLKVFNSLLVDFPATEDAFILDVSIDWYHRGELSKSKNPFVAFLCYYIALESVAVEVAEGKANLGLNFQKEDKTQREKRIVEEIKKKYSQEFLKDPLKFIEDGYFEYVKSLKEKTLKVSELVFGENHPHLTTLFKKQGDKESLYALRGRLAHGDITLLDPDDRGLIEDRLHEMSTIAKDFLKRVIFLLKPTDKLPKWSGRHQISIFPKDPRDIMVASDFKMLGKDDWKIRPEWLD